jgi:hypothetical protein
MADEGSLQKMCCYPFTANLLRRCHECNFPLGSKDLFCPRCGAKQRREKLDTSPIPTPTLPLKRRELYKLSASQSAT